MLEVINGYTVICSLTEDADPNFRTILVTRLDELGDHAYVVASARLAETTPTEWHAGEYFDSPYEASNVRLHHAYRAFDRRVHARMA